MLISLLLTLWGFTPSHADLYEIPQFREVETGFHRGGRPTEKDFDELSRLGIRTVISLEAHADVLAKESKWAAARGMKLINHPMPWEAAIVDAEIDSILKDLGDSDLRPVFLHCKHGEDRTGLLVGLYRVEHDKWSAQDAYDEMLKTDFHPEYKYLDDYFRKRSGL
jgi:protein tyrosine/serine phosphatase